MKRDLTASPLQCRGHGLRQRKGLQSREDYVCMGEIFVVGLFTFRSFNNGNPFLSYLHYLPVYFAGMWASYNRTRIFTPNVKPLLVLIGLYIVLSVLDLQHILSIALNVTFEEVLAGHAFVFNFYLFRANLLCLIKAL